MHHETIALLRDQITRGLERLKGQNTDYLMSGTGRFWSFLNSNLLLQSIISEVMQAHWDTWWKVACHNSMNRAEMHAEQRPKTHAEQAGMAACFLKKGWSPFERHLALMLIQSFDGVAENKGVFYNEVLVPLADYLIDRLNEQDAVSGQLMHFKQRCEWFNRNEMYRVATTIPEGETTDQVEDRLQETMYRYLHDHGISFQIEPYSHKGRIDLILDQCGQRKTLIEAKVFDGDGRGKDHLRKGFHQTVVYANQFQATTAYLAVFRVVEKPLIVETIGQVGFLKYVRVGSVMVFVLDIDVYPHEKAVSERGHLKPITITEAELCKPE